VRLQFNCYPDFNTLFFHLLKREGFFIVNELAKNGESFINSAPARVFPKGVYACPERFSRL
jgi:hypothetical protein